MDNLNFGHVIDALKKGKKAYRKDWYDSGKFIFLLQAGKIPKSVIYDDTLKSVLENTDSDHFEAYASIRMKTPDNKILTGWLPDLIDIFAEDWLIFD